jgi:hypothetical protein
MMLALSENPFEPLIETNSLPQLSSLLYESLSMESGHPPLAIRYEEEMEEDLAESSVQVNLTIPIAVWSGSSELTILLDTENHLYGIVDSG